MRMMNMKTFWGLTMLMGIFVAVASISYAQGIEPEEVTVAYNELSLASQGIVVRLDWSPDSQTFAISTGNDLRIYTKDLIEIAHWQGHTDLITSVDWKPDGTAIATASNDGTVRIWDAIATSATYGNTLYTLNQTGEVYGLSWSPVPNDNRLVGVEITGLEQTEAGGRSLGIVHIWNLDTQTITLSLPMQRSISNVVWSPDGQYVAYSSFQFSRDYVINVSDSSTGALVADFKGSIGYINHIAWQPNGNMIAYVDDLNQVVTVEFALPANLSYLNGFQADPLEDAYAVTWNSVGTELVIGGTDRQIHIWKPTVNEARVFSAQHTDSIIQVAWSPDGKRIASLSHDGVIRIWNLNIVPIPNAGIDQTVVASNSVSAQ